MLNEKQIIELTKKTGMIEAIDYQYRTRDKASREEMKKEKRNGFPLKRHTSRYFLLFDQIELSS